MIKAIIFDCFGVVYIDNFAEVYEFFGGNLAKDKEFLEETFFNASKGNIDSGLGVICKHLGIKVDHWRQKQKVVMGFNTELLDYIKEIRPLYKVGMLSNIGKKGLSYSMDYSVLEEYFDDIVESAKIGFAKPEARAYEIVADRLGVRLDECLFIDDRQPYITGAIHVGMKTILYTDFKSFRNNLEKILNKDNEEN